MAPRPIEDPIRAIRDAFDADHYLAHNPDVAAAGLDAWAHFTTCGWQEGRDPRADFSVSRYLEFHPDVAASGINPFIHHVLHGHDGAWTAPAGAGLDRNPELADVREAFDPHHYRALNPDLAGLDPFDHFMTVGWTEGRDPRPDFSGSAYLQANPDVAAAGLNPFVHYIRHGRAEGRPLDPAAALEGLIAALEAPGLEAVRAAFDEDHYAALVPDLPTGQDAFDHFMETGWRTGLDPNRWFSISRYLMLNADVAAAGINPFSHYILHGRGEGRSHTFGLDFRNEILRTAPPFEAHLQVLRQESPDPAATPIARLAQALAHRGTGDRLHVTVSQDNPFESFGGIQLCLRIESAALRAEGVDHLHLFPPATGMVVEINREHPPVGVVLNNVFFGHFAAADLVALAADQPRGGVSFAVHSLIGHVTADIVRVLEALGVRDGFYWVHDYSSLCAGYALMRNDVAYCGAPPPGSAACGICQYGPRRRIQIREHARLFEAFDITVIAPSDGALALWRRSFPLRPARARTHPHATLTVRRSPRRLDEHTPDRPLRVGFLGMATHHKGWPAFASLAESFASDDRYEFHQLARQPAGGVDMRFTPVAPTASDPEPMREAVEALELDVVVLWSLWPETFCFTAFEALAGGAALITHPAAGNVTTIVRERNCGLVVESEAALFDLFASGDVRKLARHARNARLHTMRYSRMTADFLLDTAS